MGLARQRRRQVVAGAILVAEVARVRGGASRASGCVTSIKQTTKFPYRDDSIAGADCPWEAARAGRCPDSADMKKPAPLDRCRAASSRNAAFAGCLGAACAALRIFRRLSSRPRPRRPGRGTWSWRRACAPSRRRRARGPRSRHICAPWAAPRRTAPREGPRSA